MKRGDAPQVQKVELLCTRITKLCTSNPSLCTQAIQGLSDFILSLEVTLSQQKLSSGVPSSQPSSSQSTRSRAASTGAKPTRRESSSNLTDTNYKTNTLNSTPTVTPTPSSKGRHPSPSPVPSNLTTDNHPLRNNRNRLESTTPPSNPDLSPPSFYQPPPILAPKVEIESPESIQKEFESFNVREKKTGGILVSDLEDPESHPVMSFANIRNATPNQATPSAPSTPLSGIGGANGTARRRTMRIFDSDENEQIEANEKRMMMKRGLDEQIQEKRRLADMQPPSTPPSFPSSNPSFASTNPSFPSFASNPSFASTTSSSFASTTSFAPATPTFAPTSIRPLNLPPSPNATLSHPSTPPSTTPLLYRTTSTFDTETPSTPTYSPLSTPQYGRFKYNQATPEEKEALNKKFHQQRELQRNLQHQMEEKKKAQTQTNSFGNTW
eukprot:Phypoly_transcript_08422.p1 GENE.Phypoly_transcript_08422~~Phypoly_transcript_08422.p1  ORF type:complete len:439 (+),score=122.61 Phypoly_transcript_08422:138-1454(+)